MHTRLQFLVSGLDGLPIRAGACSPRFILGRFQCAYPPTTVFSLLEFKAFTSVLAFFYFSACRLFSGAAHNIIINKKNAFSRGNLFANGPIVLSLSE